MDCKTSLARKLYVHQIQFLIILHFTDYVKAGSHFVMTDFEVDFAFDVCIRNRFVQALAHLHVMLQRPPNSLLYKNCSPGKAKQKFIFSPRCFHALSYMLWV